VVVRVRLQFPPLPVELELNEGPVGDFVGEFLAVAFDGLLLVRPNLLWPTRPRAVVARPKRHKQRVAVEPRRLALLERLERGAFVLVRFGLESLVRRPELLALVLAHSVVLDFVFGEVRDRFEVLVGEVSAFTESVEADEEWVPGERRVGLIRRVSHHVRRRAEWAELPERLLRVVEPLDELPCAVPEVTDSVRPGKRREVHEDTGLSVESHMRTSSS
jgi:hypothetical protein